MQQTYYLPALIILSVFSFQTFSQPGEEYQFRGNRWEGTKQIEAGRPSDAEDAELVSCVGFIEKKQLNNRDTLKLKFYLPEENARFAISVKELNPSEFYFMDTDGSTICKPCRWRRGWQGFNRWPAKEVLFPLRLSLEQLGYVARLNSSRSKLILPLVVYISRRPSTVQTYEFKIKFNMHLSNLNFTVYDSGNQRISHGSLPPPPVDAPIPVLINLARQTTGRFKLRLDYLGTDGSKRFSIFDFYHHPNVQ